MCKFWERLDFWVLNETLRNSSVTDPRMRKSADSPVTTLNLCAAGADVVRTTVGQRVASHSTLFKPL